MYKENRIATRSETATRRLFTVYEYMEMLFACLLLTLSNINNLTVNITIHKSGFTINSVLNQALADCHAVNS